MILSKGRRSGYGRWRIQTLRSRKKKLDASKNRTNITKTNHRERERERETYYSGFILHENNTAANDDDDDDDEISCSGASPCSNPTPIYVQTAPSRPSLPPRPLLRRLSTDRSKDQSFLESRARSHTRKDKKTRNRTQTATKESTIVRARHERETQKQQQSRRE
jgi:hypothetical protein